MDNERAQQHRRINNRKKSRASEIAWKRHHGAYMRGTRKRERDHLQSIYADRKDESMSIEELNKQFEEAYTVKDNEFKHDLCITFNNISGGIAMDINDKKKNVSFSTTLDEKGDGAYKILNAKSSQDYTSIYPNLRKDLEKLCNTFDEEFKKILEQYGLKSTK